MDIRTFCTIYYFALLGLAFCFALYKMLLSLYSSCTVVYKSDFHDECIMNY